MLVLIRRIFRQICITKITAKCPIDVGPATGNFPIGGDEVVEEPAAAPVEAALGIEVPDGTLRKGGRKSCSNGEIGGD